MKSLVDEFNKYKKFISIMGITIFILIIAGGMYKNSTMHAINVLKKVDYKDDKFTKSLDNVLRLNKKDGVNFIKDIICNKNVSFEKRYAIVKEVMQHNNKNYFSEVNRFLFNNLDKIKNNEGDVNNIYSYLKLNNSTENENLAIKLIKSKMDTNTCYYIDKYIKHHIGTYNKITSQKMPLGAIIKYYSENYDNQDFSKDAFIKLISNHDKPSIKKEILKSVQNVNIDDSEIIKVYLDKFKQLNSIDNIDNINKYLNSLVNTSTEIKKLNDNICSDENDINKYTKNIEDAKQEKLNSEDKLKKNISSYNEKQQNLQELQQRSIEGFVIGEEGEEKALFNNGTAYECAYINYTDYGEIPSRDRFILITHSTKFTSKGRFALNVIPCGNANIKLKEEYGAFSTKWPIYEEVDYSISNALNKINEHMSDLQNEKNTLTNTIASLNSNINSYNKNIGNLKNDILRCKNNIKELEKKQQSLNGALNKELKI